MNRLTTLFLALVLIASNLLADLEVGAKFREIIRSAKASVHMVSLKEVKSMMDKSEDFIILDVRDFNEIKASGYPKWDRYENISRGQLELLVGGSDLKVDDKIVIFCQTGNRAALAALTLESVGFKNILVADGGMSGWKMRNYPTEYIQIPLNNF
jgi:rhodanese-related sulfurtransferase